MKIKKSIVAGLMGFAVGVGGLGINVHAQENNQAENYAPDAEMAKLVATFQRMVKERVEALDPDAVEIMEEANKNNGALSISPDKMKALVEKWSAEDSPEDVLAAFERLFYQKVKEGEPEAVKIYQQGVKDGGNLSVTIDRMKELVAKWSGKKARLEHPTVKFDPEFSIGASKSLAFTTKAAGDLMLTKATVNGVEGAFIIDTGSSHSAISLEFSEKLKFSEEIRTIESSGSINSASQKVVRIKSLKISDSEFGNFDALIVPLGHFEGALGKKLSGIIGSNLLSISPYTIRFNDQKIDFGRPDQLDGGFEAPLIVITGRPAFKMAVNAGKGVQFVIDSGATESIMPKAQFQGKTVRRRGPVEIDINKNRGDRMRDYAQTESMSVAGNKLKCIPLKLVTDQKTGLLGADFLRLYDVFVDTGNQTLYFREVGKK